MNGSRRKFGARFIGTKKSVPKSGVPEIMDPPRAGRSGGATLRDLRVAAISPEAAGALSSAP
jgi:hypothetical protein